MAIYATLSSRASKKTGKYPVIIQNTYGRRPLPETTKWKVSPEEWDNQKQCFTEKFPNYRRANLELAAYIKERRKPYDVAEITGNAVDHVGKKERSKGLKKGQLTLQEYGREVRKDYPNAMTMLQRIAKYDADVLLAEVDALWLRKYTQYMKEEGRLPRGREKLPEKAGLGNTSIVLNLKFITGIINQAARERVVPGGLIPVINRAKQLEGFVWPKKDETDPVYLDTDQREKVYGLLDKRDELTKVQFIDLCYFLLSVYAGPRISDWHKFQQPADRLIERGRKFRIRTQKTNTPVVMEVGIKLRRIINLLQELNAPPRRSGTVQYTLEVLLLKKLKLKLSRISPHVGRHSFGYLCAEKGILPRVAAGLMGITEEVVEVYYHLTGDHVTSQSSALLDA